MNELPFWVEAVVAVLLIASGVFVFISALGFWRLPDFFLRMHPPALAYTFGTWCVCLAGVVSLSASSSRAALHPALIVVFLGVTVPVTTLVLARLALFRDRAANVPGTPPPLTPDSRASSAPEA